MYNSFKACRTWFIAANGIAIESYMAHTWDEYHTLVQTMERLGWTKCFGGV